MSKHIDYRVEGPIAQVRLQRPEALNALTLEMLESLTRATRGLRPRREVRAVLLTGAGRSFCAGLDFRAVLADRHRLARAFLPRPWRGTNVFQEACYGFRRLPVPVIAAVQGHCLGAGLQLALGADIRFTTAEASWSVMEGKWGLIPDMAGIRMLADQIGMAQAKHLTMTAQVITGAEAERLGLATVVDDPQSAAHELAEQLLTRSPDALAAAKRLFERSWHARPRRTFGRERREQLRLLLLPNTTRARQAAAGSEHASFADRARRWKD